MIVRANSIHFSSSEPEKCLNKDNNGKVFLVREALEKKELVYKKLTKKIANKKAQKILKSDLDQIVKNLDHPNLVKYDGYEFHEDGSIRLVMEHVDGITLAELLEKTEKIPEEIVFHITSQISDALKYLHKNLISHKNLKPTNILITSNGNIKLASYGLGLDTLIDNELGGSNKSGNILACSSKNSSSSSLKNEGKAAATFYSPSFIAPEVYKNKKYTFQSDNYTLGCLVYLMATKKAPFQGQFKNLKELYKMQMAGEYKKLEAGDFSVKMREMTQGLLFSNPERRWILQIVKGQLNSVLTTKSSQISHFWAKFFNRDQEELNASIEHCLKNEENDLSKNALDHSSLDREEDERELEIEEESCSKSVDEEVQNCKVMDCRYMKPIKQPSLTIF